MSIIMDIISVIGSGVSISGITLKDLIKKNPNKVEIERYIKFLEPKKVLTTPLDEEIIYAVIKSLEEIKKETENVRLKCNDESVSLVLLNLVLTMSEELMSLHKISNSADANVKMYKNLQKIRIKFAQALAMLCSAYDIDITRSELSKFILDVGYKPRG
ncbi:hypothetical protein D9N54_25165 [Salmonella enterica]|uniref:Uncharacterized protein n=1 Tax=Salmonella enterica TaxID=28901 RepID=A0A5T3ENW8_SALER|nr:hypothetical protein [Salmonella enterica]